MEDLSTTNAIILQVARDQTFLVDCNELWACPDARVMIVQYELFLFCGNWQLESSSYNDLGVSTTGESATTRRG